MSWFVAGTTAATAVVGAYSADQQRKAQQDANKQQSEMAAAQTQYSPWTGMQTGQANLQPVTASALQGGLQGGLSGAMFGQGMKTSQAEQAKLAAETEALNKKNALQDWNPARS